MKILKDSLTGLDGESFNASKVAGFAVVATFIGLAVADFIVNKKFSPTEFGTGAGLAIAAMGAAVKLTESTEPKP